MAKGKYQEWLTDDGLIKLQGWARDGLTDEQIAENMGINVATLYRWKDKYSEICDTLKAGKEVVDRNVENALYKRALGYKYDEITYVEVDMEQEERDELIDSIMDKYDDEHPNATAAERAEVIASVPRTKQVVQKRVTKEIAPDTTAQIFWLKNRKPNEWRDKQQVEHSGEISNHVDMSGLSLEELKRLANIDNQ